MAANVAQGGVAGSELASTRTCNSVACPVDGVVAQWIAWRSVPAHRWFGQSVEVERSLRMPRRTASLAWRRNQHRHATLSCGPLDCGVAQLTVWKASSPPSSLVCREVCSLACGAGSQVRSRVVPTNATEGSVAGPSLAGTGRSGEGLQKRDLRKEYEKRVGEYKSRAREIWVTNICTVKQGRNTVLQYSSTSLPYKITGCDVGDRVPGSCSLECDEACPQADQYACGGWQALTRESVVSANQFGINCPPLTNKKKCNQMKCPIDCVMSQWSGWAKCTKECEGGVQARTRDIRTKPKERW